MSLNFLSQLSLQDHTHLYPVKQNKLSSQIFLSNREEKDRTFERIHSFNTIINDENEVFNEWKVILMKTQIIILIRVC